MSHKVPFDDLIETANQPATLFLEIELGDELGISGLEKKTVTAKIKGELRVRPITFEHNFLPEYFLILLQEVFVVDVLSPEIAEPVGHLCIQPYNIANTAATALSGTGFAFGKPGAEVQWDKGDIIFDFNPMITIHDANYWSIQSTISNDELNHLYDSNEVEECVEVFFVHEFVPEGFLGGGWTNGGGQGTAKIVTTDANQRLGVDFTLLAHELGHVLGLKHPDDNANEHMEPASTGTLMCPGPLGDDSPMINSSENANIVLRRNPLLIYKYRQLSDDSDCNNDSDCGQC